MLLASHRRLATPVGRSHLTVKSLSPTLPASRAVFWGLNCPALDARFLLWASEGRMRANPHVQYSADACTSSMVSNVLT